MAEEKKTSKNTEKIEWRCTPEMKERLEKLFEGSGLGNKVEFLPVLVEAYEVQRLKSALPGRIDEIDVFTAAIGTLKDCYKNSLNLALDAKETAVKNMKFELETQLQTIASLQADHKADVEVIANLNKEIENLKKTVDDLNKDNEDLREKIEEQKKLMALVDKAMATMDTVTELVLKDNKEPKVETPKVEPAQATEVGK